MKILVVGGGTAGFISALILKTFTDSQVDMVYSSGIDPIGVGEGSTEHFYEFLRFVGISPVSVIKNCDVTYKCGVMYKGWTKNDYLHNVDADFSLQAGQYTYLYGNQMREGGGMTSPPLYWNNLVPEEWANEEYAPLYQYHFNTFKLADFLAEEASLRGIRRFDDKILDMQRKSNGDIERLIGEKRDYEYDFYIDATGFRKTVIGPLGAKWISYSDYLLVNSAFVFQTGDSENYNMWSLARAMNHGWMFRLPVWGRHGNGYIYDKNSVSQDNAKAEAESILGHEINIGKSFSFDPGCLDRVWINNCVAVGLSASFIEPLEASSIGTTIQQSFMLMHSISNYTEYDIKKYNDAVQSILFNIRDFVVLHYLTQKTDSQFWVDAANITLPDSLSERLSEWRHRLPRRDDFTDESRYILFNEKNFTKVLDGLDIFDRNSLANEYNAKAEWIRKTADATIDYYRQRYSNQKFITHKELLTLHRSREYNG